MIKCPAQLNSLIPWNLYGLAWEAQLDHNQQNIWINLNKLYYILRLYVSFILVLVLFPLQFCIKQTKVAFMTCEQFVFSRIITLKRGIDVDEKKFRKKQGELIRKYRKINRKTIADLAEKVDMDDKHLSKIENGKHNPTSISLFKLIAVLDIPNTFIDELKEEAKNLLDNE